MVLIGAVIFLTGLFMVMFPTAATRKQDRNIPEAVKKTRTMGAWFLIAAVIWVISSKVM